MVEVFCIPARASPASISSLSRTRAVNQSEETGEGGGFEEVLKAKEKEQAEAQAALAPVIVQPLLQQSSPPEEMSPALVDSAVDPGIAVGQRVVFSATAPKVAVDDLPAGDSSIDDSGLLEGEVPVEEEVLSLPSQPENAAPLEGAAAGEVEPAGTEKTAAQVAGQFSRALEMLRVDESEPSATSAGVGSVTGEVEKATAAGSGPVVKAPPTQGVNPSRTTKPEERLREEAPAIDGSTVVQVPGKPVAEGHPIQPEAKPVQPMVVENMHQVARAVEASIQSGKNFIRLQLHPHELGGLDVRLVSTTQGVSVTVFADQASTGRLLEMQIDQLRQTLADAGVQLAHLDVQAQAQPGQQQSFTQTPRRFFYAHREAITDEEISGMIPALSPSVGLGHRVDYQV